MKFIHFSNEQKLQLGILSEEYVIPLNNINSNIPNNMKSLIYKWDVYYDEILNFSKKKDKLIPLDKIKLHAPITNPSKILAIGLNYENHIKETGIKKPEYQMWFSKYNNTINGPYDKVLIPSVSNKVDYEVELVVVIGKGGRYIKLSEAHKHIFGYCIGNDVSVRDWQMKTTQYTLGKTFDTHAPMGPYITTSDEISNPHSLNIRSYVNNEIRQNSNTANLIFNIWEQIEYISKVMTLNPGDLIFTGTPEGTGFAMKPPRFLKPGDIVKCEIDNLGVIENTFEKE